MPSNERGKLLAGISRSFAVLCGCLILVSCGGGEGGSPPTPAASIRVLSSRPDMVSGGTALIEIQLSAGITTGEVRVFRDLVDVTSSLTAVNSGTLRGVVDNLVVGKNNIEARNAGDSAVLAKVTIRNSPITGPVFSGPHQRPWICETTASGLDAPPATGPCNVASRTDWYYKNTAGTFVPLTSLSRPFPSDLAKTTTIDGQAVDYIVRIESGTINESIYRIAIIDDPTNPIAKPWSAGGKKPGLGWNGKLYIAYVGGAGPGYRSGSNNVLSPTRISDSIISNSDDPLQLGFAVAFGTRNTYGTGENDVVSAETTAMIKEYFIKNYGLPKFTIGLGPSGGSMQLHTIAQNYPGVLDGIIPDRTFPDLVTILPDVTDCQLLRNYFTQTAAPANWPIIKISAVDGYPVSSDGSTTCLDGWSGFSSAWDNPNTSLGSSALSALQYNTNTNPTGLRGDWWTANINSVGADPATGFARSAYDNVGVQYGLGALNSFAITTTEFLDLNEKIGGVDTEGRLTKTRTTADSIALANVYKSGRVNSAVNLTLPIIDYRSYLDDAKNIHTFHRTFAKIERMLKTNGTRDNMAVWIIPSGQPKNPNLIRLSILAMNEWLENMAADKSGQAFAAKVVAARPASAKDACWDANGNRIDEPATLESQLARSSTCSKMYPIYADPRLVAGAPRSEDILKCQLKPVAASDYKVTFTAAELARLNAIFPTGVCDWSKPGVNQSLPDGAWTTYGETPGTWTVPVI